MEQSRTDITTIVITLGISFLIATIFITPIYLYHVREEQRVIMQKEALAKGYNPIDIFCMVEADSSVSTTPVICALRAANQPVDVGKLVP